MGCERDIQILSFPEKRQVRTRGLEESPLFEFEQHELCVTYGADDRLDQAEPDDCIAEHVWHFKTLDEGVLPILALAPGHVVRRIDGEYHVEWVSPD